MHSSAPKFFGHVLAYAVLEFACLDLQGQALGKPVCDLPGGRLRDEVPFSAYLFYRYANQDNHGEVSNSVQMVEFAREPVRRYGFETRK
jgi:glucarate dehydratase